MPSGSFFTYTPHTVNTAIPATLDAVNAALTALVTEHRKALEIMLSGSVALFGCDVTLGVFPNVNVAAGTVVTKSGTVVTVPAGSLALPTTANQVNYVYVSSTYAVTSGTTIPGTAMAVLAKITNNAGGTAATLDIGMFTEEQTYTAQGLLETSVHKNGTLVLRSWSYAYDAEYRVSSVLETVGTGTCVHSYTYDAITGLLTKITRTPSNIALLLANGSWLADGSQLADGVL